MTFPLQTATIRGAELFEAGGYRGEPYTLADLRDMARNFALALGYVDPPVVIGHEETQPLVSGLAENTGEPAVGWVTAVRLARRKGRDGKARWVLLFDAHGVHPHVAGLINRRAYRKVSAEVYDDPPEGAPPACRGKMLRRVALLGGELPQIKTLADLPAATFAEQPSRLVASLRWSGNKVRTVDGKAWRVFSEVTAMADAANALDDALLAANWTQEEIDQLTTGDPKAVIIAHEMREATGAAPPDNAAATPPDGAALAEPPSREQMIAELVDMGEDRAALEAMSDAELAALYDQKKGGGAVAGGGAAMMSERKLTAKFAELDAKAKLLDARLKAVDVISAKRFSEEHAAGLRRDLDALRDAGDITPADADLASTEYNFARELADASRSRVVKFGEKSVSQYEAKILSVKGKGKAKAGVRKHGETIPDPQQAGDVEKWQRVREQALASRQVATTGPTLEERFRIPVGLR